VIASDWPNAVAHIDADCFYAACERRRRPELDSVPVCVLSNQDACIVAKTYDAKAKGVRTGMPIWEAKRLVPRATFIPADFAYYGQVSAQMFAILRRFSPELEVYSLDEGFLDFNGLRTLWRKPYGAIADQLRETVAAELGITVSVGVSVTKTLAKIASEHRKPDGTTVVPGTRIEQFLARVPLADVPGIGAHRTALLAKFGIETGLDYVRAEPSRLRRVMGRPGVDLWHELRGEPVYALELVTKLPKTIAKTASLGQVTRDRRLIATHLTHHVTRLAIELAVKDYVIGHLTVFLRLKSFASIACELPLPHPTGDLGLLSRAVHHALKALYRPDEWYRGCGVIGTKLGTRAGQNLDLFGVVQRDLRQGDLLRAVDGINHRYGAGTIGLFSAMQIKRRERALKFRYPLIQCS
jgi:nucleotidyltransferase/DNA polymerase involved in DNA repair